MTTVPNRKGARGIGAGVPDGEPVYETWGHRST